jgi:hypothetical protein
VLGVPRLRDRWPGPAPLRIASGVVTAGLQSPGKACEGGTTQVATPKDLAERSAPLLPPGSQVRHAFISQTAPNFAFFFVNWATGLTMFWITYR